MGRSKATTPGWLHRCPWQRRPPEGAVACSTDHAGLLCARSSTARVSPVAPETLARAHRNTDQECHHAGVIIILSLGMATA